jgi:hypothetical protein
MSLTLRKAITSDSPIYLTTDRLDEGPERGWLIVDMAKDWARIFPGQN